MKIPYYLIVFLISSFASKQAFNQSTSKQEIISAEIQWYGQFPISKKDRTKKKINALSLLQLIAGIKSSQPTLLLKPFSLAVNSPNDIWVIDQGNQNIQHILKNKVIVPSAFKSRKINFQSLVGICYVPSQGLLFTDSRLNKIFIYDIEKSKIKSWNDTLALAQPTGIAFSKLKKEVWLIETGNHQISVFDSLRRKVKIIGKRGLENGEFNYPTSISIDEQGNVYVVDAMNYRIQLFDAEGNFISCFGKSGNVSGTFAMPKSVAVDSYGDIYVLDALFHNVQIFNKRGEFLLSFGKQGREKGEFWLPSSISIDENNIIYVTDCYNARIQMFKLDNIKIKK